MPSLRYPLFVQNERLLADTYAGPLFIWDIDKTYLATAFSSLSGLLRIPLEFAVDKRAIPGMSIVLRACRHGPTDSYACVPLYFLSASPRQLRHVIAHKMLLDGVEYDGFIFKDWLRAWLSGGLSRLTEQLGFKLCGLLSARVQHLNAIEYLVGDDTEQDALVFSLYAQLLLPAALPHALEPALKRAGMAARERTLVLDLAERLPVPHGCVGRAYIHLERQTPPEAFAELGELVVPVHGAFELALALYHDGLIRAQAVRDVAQAVCAPRGPASWQTGLATACARQFLTPAHAATLRPLLEGPDVPETPPRI